MNRIVIQNGRIIDPASKTDQLGNIYIADDKIVSYGQSRDDFTADKSIDAAGQIVCPGFIDLSVRLREPGQTRKGNIRSETRAAAAAGITTLCLPPDTHPVIDSPAVIEFIKDKAEQAQYPDILPIAALTQRLAGTELSNMYALKQAGCIAVSNAQNPVENLQTLRRAMEYAASHQLLLIYRAKEKNLAQGGCLHEGPVASQYGIPGTPSQAESIAVSQCLELAELTGCRIHFSQISCQASVDKINQAKQQGLDISADVAIHQLHLTEQDLIPFDSHYHVDPPFRSLSDKTALQQALREGTLSAVTSDHQPHDLDAKLGALPETEAGIAALETLLPLLLQLVRQNSLTLTDAIAAVTTGPAQILSLNKGQLKAGMDADICIFDPEAIWTVAKNNWYSRGQNTPYWGQSLTGRVTLTLQSGKIIHSLNQ